jgi:hypothetical protein
VNRLVALGLSLVSGTVAADSDPPPLKKQILGGDLMFVKPVDNYGDDASFGLGVLFRYERRMGSKLSLIARGGPVFHDSAVDGQSVFMFLALGGMRLNIDADRRNGSFFDAVVGMNFVRVAVNSVGVKASDSEPELTLDFGGGYQFGRFQVRGSLFYTPHVGASFGGNATSYLGLTATIGFDFSAK